MTTTGTATWLAVVGSGLVIVQCVRGQHANALTYVAFGMVVVSAVLFGLTGPSIPN